MPVHDYRLPWSLDKSASEFVIRVHVYLSVRACVRARAVLPVVLVVIKEGAGGWS